MDNTQSDQPVDLARQLLSITSLRIFAALFVAIHHTRAAWAHTKVMDFIGQVGWLGVSCFFILSGFVLMWGYNPATTYKQFILRRLIRIYPLHFLCLSASLIGFAIFHTPMAGYVGTIWGTVANFLLIHGWIPGHANIRQAWNGVSWTLSCEFFFYLVAPFFFRFILTGGNIQKTLYGVIVLWAILLIVSLIGEQHHWDATLDFILYYPTPRFVEFMLGACGAVLMRNGWKFKSRGTSVALMIIPILLYCYWRPEADGLRSGAAMIAIFVPGAFLLIMSIAKLDIDGTSSWMQNRTLVFLGEASFALYMTHALFLSVFTTVRNHFFPLSNSSVLWGEVMTIACLALMVMISVATHVGIEQPLRLWLMRKFSLSTRSTK